MAGTRLHELTQQIAEEVTRLQQQKQALEITVANLQSHRREAEAWLAENWQRYSQAKTEYADMKRQCRELVVGLERAGVK
jgi:chromosome segregation ATPase